MTKYSSEVVVEAVVKVPLELKVVIVSEPTTGGLSTPIIPPFKSAMVRPHSIPNQ
jgi:hypothetical protein